MYSPCSAIKTWDGGFADVTVSYLVASKRLGRKVEPIVVSYNLLFNQVEEASIEYLSAQLLRTFEGKFIDKSYDEFDYQISINVSIFGSHSGINLSDEIQNLLEILMKSSLQTSNGLVSRISS